MANNQSIGYGL